MKKHKTKEEALLRVGMANKIDYCLIFNFAVVWVKKQFKVFSANDFKKAYLEAGNPKPVQPNVYGSVFSNLAKEGFIFRHGTVTSKTPESKGCLIRTWISREYSLKQSQNAKKDQTLNLFD